MYFDTRIDFWTGCTPITAGCRNCPSSGKEFQKSAQGEFLKPYKFKAGKDIIVCDGSDFFHPSADAWRTEAWKCIQDNPQHKWFVCTKYAHRIKECLPADWEDGYKNVYLGISAERQRILYTRAIKLLEIRMHGRFLVIEPILERVALQDLLLITLPPPDNRKIKPFDLVFVGGEISPSKATNNRQTRVTGEEWIQSIVAECNLNQVPCYVKQLGFHLAKRFDLKARNGNDTEEEKFPKHLKARIKLIHDELES